MAKPKVIKDYDKLSPEVVEQIKLVFPRGFRKHLITFTNKEGEKKQGLPFETEEFYYLVRMTEEKAAAIIRNDDDYDADGVLRDDVKEKFEDKYEDEDFLNELNSNDDNDLGMSEEEDDDLDSETY